MIIYKDSSAFLSSAALLVSSLVCSMVFALKLEYRIPSKVVRVGEHAVLEVLIPIPPGLDVKEGEVELPTVSDELLSDASDLIILNKQFQRERGSWIWRYELTAYAPGKYTIPPIQVRMGPNTFSTESQTLSITSLRREDDNEIRPELDRVTPPLPWKKWLGYLALCLTGLCVGEYLRKQWQKWSRPKRSLPPPVILSPNHLEWLKEQFARFRSELESKHYSPKIIDEITYTIREYLSRKTAYPVVAWTTLEFSYRGTSLIEGWDRLKAIFELTDPFKFSGRESAIYDLALLSLNEAEGVLLCGK